MTRLHCNVSPTWRLVRSLAWVLLSFPLATSNSTPGGSLTPSSKLQSNNNNDHLWEKRWPWRGGAGSASKRSKSTKSKPSQEIYAYTQLARAVQDAFQRDDKTKDVPSIDDLIQIFKRLSSAQQTFKGLDGAAYEAYQRTHTSDEISTDVTGRASRTASRTAAVADGLGACELCELLLLHPVLAAEISTSVTGQETKQTEAQGFAGQRTFAMQGREVLLNLTADESTVVCDGMRLPLLLLYEPAYRGGAGIHHGGIEDLTEEQVAAGYSASGRLLVVLGEGPSMTLSQIIKVLATPPMQVPLGGRRRSSTGGPRPMAAVQPNLHAAATSLLEAIDPFVRQHNASAVHFVGHSVAGGVACLGATMLDGSLPLASQNKNLHRGKKGTKIEMGAKGNATDATLPPLSGLGKRRCSAVTLGAPPCMSPDVHADFVTSILYGDDVIGRTTSESVQHFLQRTRKALDNKDSMFGQQLNRMTDTFSLATSNLGRARNADLRLSIPGRAFLIRPRRLAGVASMHEIGKSLGGRESLRAAVLWQLNEILLSKSLWKHHQLGSYIHGLDRVHLRGVQDGDA